MFKRKVTLKNSRNIINTDADQDKFKRKINVNKRIFCDRNCLQESILSSSQDNDSSWPSAAMDSYEVKKPRLQTSPHSLPEKTSDIRIFSDIKVKQEKKAFSQTGEETSLDVRIILNRKDDYGIEDNEYKKRIIDVKDEIQTDIKTSQSMDEDAKIDNAEDGENNVEISSSVDTENEDEIVESEPDVQCVKTVSSGHDVIEHEIVSDNEENMSENEDKNCLENNLRNIDSEKENKEENLMNERATQHKNYDVNVETENVISNEKSTLALNETGEKLKNPEDVKTSEHFKKSSRVIMKQTKRNESPEKANAQRENSQKTKKNLKISFEKSNSQVIYDKTSSGSESDSSNLSNSSRSSSYSASSSSSRSSSKTHSSSGSYSDSDSGSESASNSSFYSYSSGSSRTKNNVRSVVSKRIRSPKRSPKDATSPGQSSRNHWSSKNRRYPPDGRRSLHQNDRYGLNRPASRHGIRSRGEKNSRFMYGRSPHIPFGGPSRRDRRVAFRDRSQHLDRSKEPRLGGEGRITHASRMTIRSFDVKKNVFSEKNDVSKHSADVHEIEKGKKKLSRERRKSERPEEKSMKINGNFSSFIFDFGFSV